MRNWLPTLDKKMEAAQENPHWNFRLFLSSEPAADVSMHAIPQVLKLYFIYFKAVNIIGIQINDVSYLYTVK